MILSGERRERTAEALAVGLILGVLADWAFMPITGEAPEPIYGPKNLCTGSMRPAIVCGDIPIYGPPEGIRIGDILHVPTANAAVNICTGAGCTNARAQSSDPFSCVYPAFPAGVLHRVIAIHERDGGVYYETQGDNVIRPDACYTPANAVIAKLAGIEKGLPPMDTTAYDRRYDAWMELYRDYERELALYQDGGLPHEDLMTTYNEMSGAWRTFLAERVRLKI